MFNFALSEHLKPLLNFEGYQYTKKGENRTMKEWRCQDRGCSSFLSKCSKDLQFVRHPFAHDSQSINDTKNVVDESIIRMKRRAREETAPIPQISSQKIVKTCMEHSGLSTSLLFPTLRSIDSTLYRLQYTMVKLSK